MIISPKQFLIICPLVFLAGLIDAIAGGGGLISLPAYLIAGLPPHVAIGTNKFSSTFGTITTTLRFALKKLIDIKLAIPSAVCALIGSFLGSNLSLFVDEKILKIILYAILPVTAFLVLNKHLFKDNNPEEFIIDTKTKVYCALIAFTIGMYDGFFGPGTGTFLIIAYTIVAKMPVLKANGLTKTVNATTNVTSLIVFLIHGQVLLPIALAAAASNIAGNLIGSSLALHQGSKLVKPVILFVLFLLLLKILGLY
ncbi:MAG: TSUP family transporter [Treponema sp.]|nr:TSUP family transporter [Treponema sp.]